MLRGRVGVRPCAVWTKRLPTHDTVPPAASGASHPVARACGHVTARSGAERRCPGRPGGGETSVSRG
eukprot:666596-Prymnesium_polylepis.1